MRDRRYIEMCRGWLHGDADTAKALDGRVRRLLFWRRELMTTDPDPDLVAIHIDAQRYLASAMRPHHIEGLVERMEPLTFIGEYPAPEDHQPRLVQLTVTQRPPVEVWRMAQFDAWTTWLLAYAWYTHDGLDRVARQAPHRIFGIQVDQRPIVIAQLRRQLDSAEKALACIRLASADLLDDAMRTIALVALANVQSNMSRAEREHILAGQDYETQVFERALFRRWVVRRVDELRA